MEIGKEQWSIPFCKLLLQQLTFNRFPQGSFLKTFLKVMLQATNSLGWNFMYIMYPR